MWPPVRADESERGMPHATQAGIGPLTVNTLECALVGLIEPGDVQAKVREDQQEV